MTPLGLVLAGLLVVVLDLRVDGFDLVSDPVGWVLVLVGLGQLTGRSPWFGLAAAASVVGLLAGLPAAVAEPGAVVSATTSVVQTVIVFAVCSGILQAVPAPGPRARAWANPLRWTDLGLTVLLTVLVVALPEPGTVVLGAVLVIALLVWFLVLLAQLRDHPSLQATGRGTGRGAPRRTA